jgi:methyl coenzyme M reductase beta subunit
MRVLKLFAMAGPSGSLIAVASQRRLRPQRTPHREAKTTYIQVVASVIACAVKVFIAPLVKAAPMCLGSFPRLTTMTLEGGRIERLSAFFRGGDLGDAPGPA